MAVGAACRVVGLAGTVLLVWASVLLGRFMIHEAAVREDHALLDGGPYRFVRHWLGRKTPVTLRQVDPIIRQLTLYRDFIDQKTQENQE